MFKKSFLVVCLVVSSVSLDANVRYEQAVVAGAGIGALFGAYRATERVCALWARCCALAKQKAKLESIGTLYAQEQEEWHQVTSELRIASGDMLTSPLIFLSNVSAGALSSVLATAFFDGNALSGQVFWGAFGSYYWGRTSAFN